MSLCTVENPEDLQRRLAQKAVLEQEAVLLSKEDPDKGNDIDEEDEDEDDDKIKVVKNDRLLTSLDIFLLPIDCMSDTSYAPILLLIKYKVFVSLQVAKGCEQSRILIN